MSDDTPPVTTVVTDYHLLSDLLHDNASAYKILRLLMHHGQQHGAILISNSSIAEFTRQSCSTVKRSLKVLEEKGWVKVLKIGTSSLYILPGVKSTIADNSSSRVVDAKIIIDSREAEIIGI